MNYLLHYEKIIARARNRVLDGYTERHHVVPRCMGGTNAKNNIVRLTGEEHYVAHQLLVKMYPSVLGLAMAASFMAKKSTGNKAYGWLRRKHSKNSSLMQKGQKRKPLSLEHKAKLAKTFSGRIFSKEWKAKISSAKRGQGVGRKLQPFTEEHRAKISSAKKGKKPSLQTMVAVSACNKTRVISEETRRRQSQSGKGRMFSEEHRLRLSQNKLAYYAKRTSLEAQ